MLKDSEKIRQSQILGNIHTSCYYNSQSLVLSTSEGTLPPSLCPEHSFLPSWALQRTLGAHKQTTADYPPTIFLS